MLNNNSYQFRVTLSVCSQSTGSRYDQTFSFGYKKDIALGANPGSSTCWDVQSGDGAPVLTYACHGQGGNQLWKYNVVSCIFVTTICIQLGSKYSIRRIELENN
jgi:hypothetical protein